MGEGGRVVVNVTNWLAGEAEATRQPTDYNLPIEIHTFLAAKVAYRAEQRRWLKFAGMNFFGVIGLAFVNRSVDVEDTRPPHFCFYCVVQQWQTAGMVEWGGGFEVVPARAVAIRFDATHANFSQPIPYSNFNQGEPQSRTYLKLSKSMAQRKPVVIPSKLFHRFSPEGGEGHSQGDEGWDLIRPVNS